MESTAATTTANATATTANVESAGNDAFPTADGDDGDANIRVAAAATATTIPATDGRATWTTVTSTAAGVQRDAGTIRPHATVWEPTHDVKWRGNG